MPVMISNLYGGKLTPEASWTTPGRRSQRRVGPRRFPVRQELPPRSSLLLGKARFGEFAWSLPSTKIVGGFACSKGQGFESSNFRFGIEQNLLRVAEFVAVSCPAHAVTGTEDLPDLGVHIPIGD